VAATKKRRPTVVNLLIFLEVFLGINGLVGGIPFLIAPDGSILRMPFSHLQNTPFRDFTVPGLLLTIFLGLYPLAAAYGVWKLPPWRWPEAINPFRQFHWSWAGSIAAGVIAMVWIVVQIQWIPLGFLHVFIFVWGLLIVLTAMLRGVREYCKRA